MLGIPACDKPAARSGLKKLSSIFGRVSGFNANRSKSPWHDDPPGFLQVGEYGLHNTPAGIRQIIDAAIKVCPALADLAIERTWAGLRPVTPDSFPVLGASPRCPNLFVAGGYWRNGVLLAPKTSQLVADAVCGSVSPQDQVFSQAFAMDRFSVPEGGQPPRRLESSQMPAAGRAQTPPSAKTLEMERAALEGSNDGSMLSGLEGLFGKQPGGKAEVGVYNHCTNARLLSGDANALYGARDALLI